MKISNRLKKELDSLLNKPLPGISTKILEENYRYLEITIYGPPDTPYEKGNFVLEVYITGSYPMEAPLIRFITRVYHPNVDKVGRICLDILKKNWSPALQISTVMLSIQLLLASPNCEDPIDDAVAKHFINDPIGAKKKAIEMTIEHATVKK